MRRNISRCGETKRIAEEDLAAAREAEEDEKEQKEERVEKKETRTKGGGGTQIAAAKKAHAFSPQLQFFPSTFPSLLSESRGETIVFIRTSIEISRFV